MNIKIRAANINDLNAVQKLHLMLLRREYAKFDDTLDYAWTFSKTGEDYFKKRISGDGGCVFVAESDEGLIGYLATSIDEEDFKLLPKFAELESIFIIAKYRGLGVGSKLNQALIDWAKSKGLDRLRVSPATKNTDAINFYRKMEFTDQYLILEKKI